MINPRIILISFLLICNSFAQSISVVETKQLPIDSFDESYYPFFSKDDSQVFFTKQNYEGLYAYKLDEKKISRITELSGAGYNPLLLEDEAIVYRSHKIVNGRKYQSVFSHDLKNATETVLQKDIRELQIPNQMVSNSLVLLKNKRPEKVEFESMNLSKLGNLKKSIYVEDNNLNLIEENQTKTINPLGKGVYVWESISRDGEMILFTFGNQGAFICDLEGNILDSIKEAHYPKFSPNGKYISYMVDKDNGTDYISSDIFVYSIEQKKSYAITKTDNQIEMYPNWSNDGNKLTYNTLDGKLFLSTLEFEN